VLAALFFRHAYGERHLSAWLIFAAVSLSIKEALNYWHSLRQKKRQRDVISDAEEGVDKIPKL
jgi:hypothetical protein